MLTVGRISDPKNSVPQRGIEPQSLAFWVSTIPLEYFKTPDLHHFHFLNQGKKKFCTELLRSVIFPISRDSDETDRTCTGLSRVLLGNKGTFDISAITGFAQK